MTYKEGDNTSFTFDIFPSKRKTVRKTKLIMTGNLDITNVLEIKEMLLPVFDQYDIVDVVLEDVKTIDLTLIQLLSIVNKHIVELKKEMSLKAQFNEEIGNVLTSSGFVGMFKKPTKILL